jgi:hypothetical protein
VRFEAAGTAYPKSLRKWNPTCRIAIDDGYFTHITHEKTMHGAAHCAAAVRFGE